MMKALFCLATVFLLTACGPHTRDGVQKDSETLADRMQKFTMGLNGEN